jgi:hypothetical protein
MCACADQRDGIFCFIPYQKPVRFDMALPQTFHVALKTMHSMLWLKWLAVRDRINDRLNLA